MDNIYDLKDKLFMIYILNYLKSPVDVYIKQLNEANK